MYSRRFQLAGRLTSILISGCACNRSRQNEGRVAEAANSSAVITERSYPVRSFRAWQEVFARAIVSEGSGFQSRLYGAFWAKALAANRPSEITARRRVEWRIPG